MDEQKIALYMKNLDLTREEAIELIKDEEEDNLPDLTDEQKKVAKEMAQADRKKEATPRKRERKIDNDKRLLITTFVGALAKTENVTIINPEREIEFIYNGAKYRLTLAKPRK